MTDEFEPTGIADTSVVQSDLSVNLFMVLLAVLATLAITLTVVSKEGFRTYLTSEPASDEVPMALSHGWLPVQPLRQRLLVRRSGLWLLDSTAIARARLSGQRIADDIPGYDVSRPLYDDPEPSSYLVDFGFGPDEPVDEITAWHIESSKLSLGAIDTWPAQWFSFLVDTRQIELVIYPGAEELAWHVAYQLYYEGATFRLLFQREQRLRYGRRTVDYTLEAIYK